MDAFQNLKFFSFLCKDGCLLHYDLMSVKYERVRKLSIYQGIGSCFASAHDCI